MSKQKLNRQALKVAAVNLCRWTLSAVFIFSGFVKANDPRGTQYKLSDYATAFGLSGIPDFTLAVIAVLLAAFEFTLGIHILVGHNSKSTAKVTLLFMSAMTLLTLYIAIFNPVSDCGCFGDLIVISNNATFAKNVALLAATIVILRYNDLYIRILGQHTQWFFATLTPVLILLFSVLSIHQLPFFDYRPYKIGTDLRAALDDSPKYDVKIIYEKNGKRLELSPDDDDPDPSWKYVETLRTPLHSSDNLKAANFYVFQPGDSEDITEDIIFSDGYTFLLVIPDLLKAYQGSIDLINEIYEYCLDNGYQFYCLTGSTTTKAQYYWREHTGAEYPFYNSDERELKTIVRSNPGLVLLKDGQVIGKWSCYDLPDEYDLTGPLETLPIGKISENNISINKLFNN